ncbi:hypothetical protein Kisp01_66450 [Kineosporia sp. NBRC 101677]|uniref:hypothetical protein n=1 Tax=Kineosporia sp. NBRC 101677 TaxID=3032197 RepID=UPI0024A5AB8F|nr:hypothetical protein [Kineosporia sp. NBRC 101677]GLY19631.1 hypothetical protein Kisp01_66450 [Kineosporia sp. NBRC 101677]
MRPYVPFAVPVIVVALAGCAEAAPPAAAAPTVLPSTVPAAKQATSSTYTVGGGQRLAGQIREIFLQDGAVRARVSCPDFKGRTDANGMFTGIDGTEVNCRAMVTRQEGTGLENETQVAVGWSGGEQFMTILEVGPPFGTDAPQAN